MCFGNQTTSTSTSSSNPDPMIRSAALNNINFATNLRDTGFQRYTGEQVAPFSQQQQSSFGMTDSIANNGTANDSRSLIDRYSGSPASSISAGRIADNMSPYMNQYVMEALAPQLRQFDLQAADQNRATDAQATASGAFGDARAGMQRSNDVFNQNVARQGLVADAYNRAFNTAIGAGAQDVSNNMSAQGTNANLLEQALQRALGGSSALQGLQNQQLGVAQAQNAAGQQQTANDQARRTADFNQWLMGQQYPFQTADLLNRSIATGTSAVPPGQTQTQSRPDNSGFALLGSLGTLLLSDAREKDDISQVGEMFDGTPVFSYSYKRDPAKRTHIGVMAQDVQRRRPEAVVTLSDGTKMVDYRKATELSRELAAAM